MPLIVLLLATTVYPFGVMNRVDDYHPATPAPYVTTLGSQNGGGGSA